MLELSFRLYHDILWQNTDSINKLLLHRFRHYMWTYYMQTCSDSWTCSWRFLVTASSSSVPPSTPEATGRAWSCLSTESLSSACSLAKVGIDIDFYLLLQSSKLILFGCDVNGQQAFIMNNRTNITTLLLLTVGGTYSCKITQSIIIPSSKTNYCDIRKEHLSWQKSLVDVDSCNKWLL